MEDKKVLNNEELEKVAGGSSSIETCDLTFHCQDCGYVYIRNCGCAIVQSQISYVTDSMKCPKCGGSYIFDCKQNVIRLV